MTAAQIPSKKAAEVRNTSVAFVGMLDDGELLTGTPTIAEVTTSDLTFANIGLNAAAITVDGEACAISQAVKFKVSGGVAGTIYTIRVTVSTTSTPAQTFVRDHQLEVT